ncbi:DUF2065 domain-containing protein [Limnohabitans radicicola]|uniref:DUF2065 domain-containing protein n=1 Tax=Limnohabitans radicicola TaxID=2771427 RepID=A0A927FI91_9BURK|nr:DUF2065 domain-containing protein [Limnohabitans radicicola]MBD8051002.1 DUF2065 domain-containing protein [Limnohabitans radicicola]
MSDAWLLALGLMLIFEGLMPMVAPLRWRRLFEQLMQMQDGQIRFFGLFMVLAGLILVWWVG